jgi:hypothetical protein
MALLTALNVESLLLHEFTTNQKGAKSCAISYQDGSPIRVKLCETPLRSPFGFSSWDEGSNRKNLDFSIVDEALRNSIVNIDQWVMQTVMRDSPKYLGKQLSAQLIEEMYKPSLTHSKEGQYPPTLRTKVTVGEGHKQLRCWGSDKQRRDLPSDARACELVPMVTLRSLWQMGSSFGLLWETEDLQIFEEPQTCPL